MNPIRPGRLRPTTLMLLTFVSLIATRPVDAAMVIGVENATLPPGFFGVTLQSTEADVDARVTALNFRLTLSNASNPATLLQFTTTTNAALLNDPNYLFGTLTSAPDTVLSAVNPQVASFSDFVIDANSPGVDVSAGKLAGRFAVIGAPAAFPVEGDRFDVTVSDVEIFLGNSLTLFAGTITTIPGTITVVTAIPEPSSIVAIAIGAAGLIRRQRRQRSSTQRIAC